LKVDLPGGLKLSLLPKKTRGERITAEMTLHFGDENSLKGQSAPAMFAGQLLMRGSAKHTRQQIRDEFDRLKAQVSIGGGSTSVNASIQALKPQLADVLTLVAEILKEPAFPENEFTQLKQQYLASYENQKSDPGALASNRLQRHLRPAPKDDVRYVPTIDERIAEVNAVTLDQVKAFYREFYGASKGEITFIGDFDPETVQKQIAALFGDWKSPKPYARVTRPFVGVPVLIDAIETPDKANATWMASIPVKMNDAHPDYPAMVFGNYLLGSGMGSRLFQRVRNKEGLSYGVGSQFSAPAADDDARFSASASCAPENTPKVEAVFKDELTKILTDGYTETEVEAGKKSWLQARKVSRASDGELINRLQNHRYWGRTMVGDDAALEARISALTPAQVLAAMKKHLDVSKLNIVRAGDFKKANVTWGATAAQ
jgi:zinc protease